MPPSKRQVLSSVVEEVPIPSDAKSNPNPSVIEDNASSSSPGKASKDGVLGGWRRSERVRIEIPVDVYAYAEDKEPIFAQGKTLDVSAHGALLALPLPVQIGQTLRLVHRRTKREIECHVLRFVRPYPEGGGDVGVEFVGRSQHFWAIDSPPVDWDPGWVPNALPQRPPPVVLPAQTRPKDVIGPAFKASPGTAGAWQSSFGVGRTTVNHTRKHWRVLKMPAVALAALVAFLILWTSTRRSGDANSAATGNALPAGVAPEDASRIPRIERTRLAITADFDPDAISWLRGSDQQANGKIPGFYSGAKKSNAYILVGKANERRVVIFAGEELRYKCRISDHRYCCLRSHGVGSSSQLGRRYNTRIRWRRAPHRARRGCSRLGRYPISPAVSNRFRKSS